MTQYFTDFSEYSTGQQPSDWSNRYAAMQTFSVEADVGAEGGQLLRLLADNARSLASWDEIDADANRDDVEVAYKFRVDAFGSEQDNPAPIRAVGRASGSAGTETLYNHGLEAQAILRTSYIDGGSFNTLTDQSISNRSLDTWYWVRARINGSDHKVRIWTDGSAEPGTWDIEDVDSTITGVGWVGLFTFHQGVTVDIDVFGVGTNGDVAPTESLLIPLYESVDDDPASPSDSDWINNAVDVT